MYRIVLPEEKCEQTGQDSYAGAISSMSVPTYATAPSPESFDCLMQADTVPKMVNHEHILGQGPAFVVENILSKEDCENLITTSEEAGYRTFPVGSNNHHGALQVIVSESLCKAVFSRLESFIDVGKLFELATEMEPSECHTAEQYPAYCTKLSVVGLNRRWRFYRYEPGGKQRFAPHIDAGFPPTGLSPDGKQMVWDDSNSLGIPGAISRLTVLFYLNNDFEGGETVFYNSLASDDSNSRVVLAVRPQQGSCLVFPQAVGEAAVEYARYHWPLHEGSPVICGDRPKYVIRSDIICHSE